MFVVASQDHSQCAGNRCRCPDRSNPEIILGGKKIPDTLHCGRRYVDFRGVKCVKWSTVECRRGVMELDVSYFPGPLTRADVKSPGSLTVKSS